MSFFSFLAAFAASSRARKSEWGNNLPLPLLTRRGRIGWLVHSFVEEKSENDHCAQDGGPGQDFQKHGQVLFFVA